MDKTLLEPEIVKSLRDYQNAACYTALAMCLVTGNVSFGGLKRDRYKESTFHRIVDRWKTDMMFAIGPGYGMPATLAALWLDGSLQKLLPEMTHSPAGLSNLVTKFSAPDGLSDWNTIESIDPKTSGAVIPIVHCDGLKDVISDDWFADLATNGFQVCVINGLEDKIQRAARSDEPTINSPRRPIIALHVPVGHAYPKDMHGAIFQSQQQPFARDITFQGHLDTLQTWHRKFKIPSLLAGGKPNASILGVIPDDDNKKLRLLTAKNPYVDSSLISQPKLNLLYSPTGVLADQAEKMLELFVDDYSGDKRRRPIQFVLEHWDQGFAQGCAIDSQLSLPYEIYVRSLHDAMVEYARFTDAAKQMRWRWERASMNFIEMHPLADEGLDLIQKVLDIKGAVTGVYFPPDANCFLSIVEN
ncbi:d-xylulose 5-phosphate d-fructose 6-phosphate, partial [Colletotrichum musicola]